MYLHMLQALNKAENVRNSLISSMFDFWWGLFWLLRCQMCSSSSILDMSCAVRVQFGLLETHDAIGFLLSWVGCQFIYRAFAIWSRQVHPQCKNLSPHFAPHHIAPQKPTGTFVVRCGAERNFGFSEFHHKIVDISAQICDGAAIFLFFLAPGQHLISSWCSNSFSKGLSHIWTSFGGSDAVVMDFDATNIAYVYAWRMTKCHF